MFWKKKKTFPPVKNTIRPWAVYYSTIYGISVSNETIRKINAPFKARSGGLYGIENQTKDFDGIVNIDPIENR